MGSCYKCVIGATRGMWLWIGWLQINGGGLVIFKCILARGVARFCVVTWGTTFGVLSVMIGSTI